MSSRSLQSLIRHQRLIDSASFAVVFLGDQQGSHRICGPYRRTVDTLDDPHHTFCVELYVLSVSLVTIKPIEQISMIMLTNLHVKHPPRDFL